MIMTLTASNDVIHYEDVTELHYCCLTITGLHSPAKRRVLLAEQGMRTLPEYLISFLVFYESSYCVRLFVLYIFFGSLHCACLCYICWRLYYALDFALLNYPILILWFVCQYITLRIAKPFTFFCCSNIRIFVKCILI